MKQYRSTSWENEVFVCLDCETTGLDVEKDHIIEVAAIRFSLDTTHGEFETLIDPGVPIPAASTEIHKITDSMVQGKPKIHDALPRLLNLIGHYPIIGHGIHFDIGLLAKAAERAGLSTTIRQNTMIDTLRMARLYGQSASNSLESLREHFRIEAEGAHRAMSDVVVNIAVFKALIKQYQSLKRVLEVLKKPISMKTMPLGKHKGRLFRDVPLNYLVWAANKDFDDDLLFSIRSEISRRKKGDLFGQATNPFYNL